MRGLVLVAGLPAVTALLAVSIAMNFRFGMSLGGGVDGLIYGGASASADVLKSLMPFVLAWALGKDRWPVAIAASLLWLIFTGYSLASSLGFSAKTRADSTAGRQVIAERYADNRATLKDILARLAVLPVSGSVSTLEAMQVRLRHHYRWKATSGCTDATITASIRYCRRYAKTYAELQNARQRAALERQRYEVQTRLDKLTDRGVVKDADPQISFLVELLPVSKSTVRKGLILMVALLVELGSGLGFYVLLGTGAKRQGGAVQAGKRGVDQIEQGHSALVARDAVAMLPAPETSESKPMADIGRPQLRGDWISEQVFIRASAQAPATLLYEDFCAWAAKSNAPDMTFTQFGQWLEAEGFASHRHNGRLQYRGLAVMTRLKA